MAEAATMLIGRLRRRLAQHPWLTTLASAALVVIVASSVIGDRQIVINTSGSVPPGLYSKVDELITVGRLVDFEVPPGDAQAYVRARTGRDPSGWFLLKPVVAGPGDLVDARGDFITIDGRCIGPTAPVFDGAGRPVPAWRERRRLEADEWFVYSSRIPQSFDGRCFGPIRTWQVKTVRQPIMRW